jgi:hypothetical protein
VPHSFIFTVPEPNTPTLWPPGPNERTPLESAVEAREEENRALRSLVVSLSEIILKTVTGKK